MITSTDPIADMLTRIRNAAAVSKREVVLPYSKMKETVAKVLVSSNFVDRVEVSQTDTGFKQLKVVINQEDTNSRITNIERISKPGRRVYVGTDGIPSVRQGRGIVVVSTSKGVMTGREARKEKLGGELICKVY
ncbi:MAG: 30S ribosomal protein S8 [Patescibacteria group bacterium]